MSEIYSFNAVKNDGEELPFSEFEGKVLWLLIPQVNAGSHHNSKACNQCMSNIKTKGLKY